MMKDLKKLQSLHRVTEMALNTKQARVAALRDQSNALKQQITDLDQAVLARGHKAGQSQSDVALQAGVDLVWHRWIEGRKIAINTERARLEAEIDKARAEMAREFGRHRVVETLRDDAWDARYKS